MAETDIVARLTEFLQFSPDDDIADALAEITSLQALLKEAADDLTVYVNSEHPYRNDYPDEMRRYNRDMDLVNRIRKQP